MLVDSGNGLKDNDLSRSTGLLEEVLLPSSELLLISQSLLKLIEYLKLGSIVVVRSSFFGPSNGRV